MKKAPLRKVLSQTLTTKWRSTLSLDLGFGQRLKTCCEEMSANIEFYNGGNALNLLHFENFHLLLLSRNRNKSRFGNFNTAFRSQSCPLF